MAIFRRVRLITIYFNIAGSPLRSNRSTETQSATQRGGESNQPSFAEPSRSTAESGAMSTQKSLASQTNRKYKPHPLDLQNTSHSVQQIVERLQSTVSQTCGNPACSTHTVERLQSTCGNPSSSPTIVVNLTQIQTETIHTSNLTAGNLAASSVSAGSVNAENVDTLAMPGSTTTTNYNNTAGDVDIVAESDEEEEEDSDNG